MCLICYFLPPLQWDPAEVRSQSSTPERGGLALSPPPSHLPPLTSWLMASGRRRVSQSIPAEVTLAQVRNRKIPPSFTS